VTFGFPTDASIPHPYARRRRGAPVFSTRGMGAAQHPLVTGSILRTLAAGGNAVDATIAGAWAAAVVMPAACGVGGDLFAIVSKPGEPVETVLSSGIGPQNASLEFMREHGDQGGRVLAQQGPLSPSVPGFPAGVFELHRRYGSQPMPELAAPAINYAVDGFPVTPSLARYAELTQPLLSRFEASAAVFLPGGRLPKVGQILRQADLGRSISRLAEEGDALFYQGALGRELTDALASIGGKLAMDDFVDHAATVTPPITTTYRNYVIHETGFPTPGLVLLEALNLVEQDDMAALGVDAAPGIHLSAEAIKLAFADRLAYFGDPRYVEPATDRLISKEWAATRRQAIDMDEAATEVSAGVLSDGDTTYLCAIDGEGMMVSMIISVSAVFGSGVIAGETGILLNNRAGHCFSLEEGHPNFYAPGKKTVHTLNCYLVASGDGTPIMVGGTPGGDSQPQWNLQTLTALIDAGLDVQAAAETPRWTVWPGTYPIEVGNPYELRIEAQVGDDVIEDLKRRGHAIKVEEPWAQGGSVQLIARDPETGVLCGGSDPRAEGLAAGI
jgi:gamma-glutamyltranspeptidase / glutathione hydrolase